jgi:hypothetical protein
MILSTSANCKKEIFLGAYRLNFVDIKFVEQFVLILRERYNFRNHFLYQNRQNEVTEADFDIIPARGSRTEEIEKMGRCRNWAPHRPLGGGNQSVNQQAEAIHLCV